MAYTNGVCMLTSRHPEKPLPKSIYGYVNLMNSYVMVADAVILWDTI
jgi:hypothetical protein